MDKNFELYESNTDNITIEIQNGNYNLFSLKSFFGFDDGVRFIKMLNIFVNIILNLMIVISIIKKKRRKFSKSFELAGNILVINFIHTLSYIINWMTHLNSGITIKDHNNRDCKVGALLIGNPTGSFGTCKLQGLMLVFSALSQEILINLFFYLINKTTVPSRQKIILVLLSLGYFFPFIIALLIFSAGGVGLNDRYCYIKKYNFDIDNKKYSIFSLYRLYIINIYSFRALNFIFSSLLLYKIINYVKKNKLKKRYILQTSFILIVQMITIIIGLIYRMSQLMIESKILTDIYLSINTLDGILFPLSFSIFNGIYTDLFNFNIKTESATTLCEDIEEAIDKTNNSNQDISKRDNKSIPLCEFKDDNNFEISYY